MPQRKGWSALIPWSTVVPVLAGIAAWRLVWGDWTSGALVALLLSVHEAGHLLAAEWRRLPVRRAPLYLPGLGTFLPTAAARPADRLWLLLGGPLIGSLAALATKVAGLRWGAPGIAFAGDFALVVNLLDMTPIPPLDGGLMVLETGWLGLVPAAFVAGYLVGFSLKMLVGAFAFFGLLIAVRFVLQARPAGRGSRLVALCLYVAVALAVLGAAGLSGRTVWPPLRSVTALTALLVALPAAGVFVRRAFAPGTGALVRYVTAGLLGWPYYLLFMPTAAAYLLTLTAHVLGLPGLRWLRRLLATAQWGDFHAGWGAAWAYDCLMLQGRFEAAEVWLEEMHELLQAAGAPAFEAAAARLELLGYGDSATRWRLTWGQPLPTAAGSPDILAEVVEAPRPPAWDLHSVGVEAWLVEWLLASVPLPPPGFPPPAVAPRWGFSAAEVRLLPVAGMLVAALVGAGLGVGRSVPPAPAPPPAPVMPQRDASGAAIVLGDAAVSRAELGAYQALFTQTILPALAQDTRLRPGAEQPEIAVYGDMGSWQAVGGSDFVAFYNRHQHRIYLATFRLKATERPGALAAMYTLWLFDANGGIDGVLHWFASGVASHEAARVTEGRGDWNTAFYAQQWQALTGELRGRAVPVLARAKSDDPFTLAAVGYLLNGRSRSGLPDFFAARRAGDTYLGAFTSAFGVTPEQFQVEFAHSVAARRAG